MTAQERILDCFTELDKASPIWTAAKISQLRGAVVSIAFALANEVDKLELRVAQLEQEDEKG